MVMSTVTVNVSFQDSLLNEIDKTARNEYRSRSELIREAARLYIQRQSQWNDLFQLGDMAVQKQHLSEHDVATEIKAVRKAKTTMS
jgi:metal-responsive CopG/Arc/MetJ family transcriptional regulator